MSDTAARWITTTPEARLTSGAEKVSARDSLAPGTRLLDEFEILRVLGTGGFGIVYLARDHVLQRDVAIKEYMPAMLSRRGEGASVAMRASTAGCARTFERGLESFLGEARLLASFDHPALVKVYRFWRDNGTAYMAMPYYPGQTLKDVRLQMLHPPREPWLHALIAPLLGALEQLHAHDVFHRDVAPDNILVLANGQPVLLDFGCARRAVVTGSQWFTAHLKPQFAPLEQYGEDESVGQGPWTDLYSLGATLYFVVTGRAPVPSVVRAARDTLPALSAPVVGTASPTGLSPRLLATIDWILALAPHDRPRDVATVRSALLGEIVPPPPSPRFAAGSPAPAAAAPVDVASVVGSPASVASAPVASVVGSPSVASAPVASAAVPPSQADPAPTVVSDDRLASSGAAPASPAHARARRGMRPGAALVIACAGLATVGWGAFSLQARAPEVAQALPRETLVLPEAIEAELPSRSPMVAPARVAATAPAVAQQPSPVVAPQPSPALAPPPGSPRGSAVLRDAERASTRLVDVSPAPPRMIAATEVDKPARAAKRSSPRAAVQAKGGAAERPVCTDDAGMLTTALCILNPCRDPTQRANAKCVDRQRAEQARLRRLASAG